MASWLQRAGIASTVLSLGACGAAHSQPAAGPSAAVTSFEAGRCAVLSAEHARDVAEGHYVAADLLQHGSLQAQGVPTRTTLPERDFITSLTQFGPDQPKTTLILARGGTGKSTLAGAIEAQTCAQVLTFRIDLMTEIAARGETFTPGQNRIVERMSELLKLDNVGGPETAVRGAVGSRPCLVILDSLDEVPVVRRPGIAHEIDDFVTRSLPGVRAVVLTRPPVFNSDYGLKTLGARLEIPQLTCAEADAAIAHSLSDATEREQFIGFVHRYGIDRKVQAPDHCYYPHLSTWRDLQVVQRLARNSGYDQRAATMKDFTSSRAQVYTSFATAQIEKDLRGVPLGPAEALAVVDRMVAVHSPDQGQRNLMFTLKSCLDVIGPKALAPHPECERLLQSSLFTKAGDAEWRFVNQSVGDLFLARWTGAGLVKDDQSDCTLIEARSGLLESSEIAGFLVGQSAGQACLAEVAQALCSHAGYAQSVFEQLDQGLPAGPERAAIVAAASKQLELMRPDPCARALVERLEGAVSAPNAATPAAAPKAGKKGKAR